MAVDKINSAIGQGTSYSDWDGLLSGVSRDDVVSCTDGKWMSSFVKAVAISGDSTGQHADALNEYYRRNFRKISTEDAIATLTLLGQLVDEKPHYAASLDS